MFYDLYEWYHLKLENFEDLNKWCVLDMDEKQRKIKFKLRILVVVSSSSGTEVETLFYEGNM